MSTVTADGVSGSVGTPSTSNVTWRVPTDPWTIRSTTLNASLLDHRDRDPGFDQLGGLVVVDVEDGARGQQCANRLRAPSRDELDGQTSLGRPNSSYFSGSGG